MKKFRPAAGLTVLLWTTLLGMPAQASLHLWEIQEIYTNYDGSVQFIELATSASSQNFVNGQRIQATSDGATNTFTFSSNVTGSTTNKSLLIATPGFAALPGGVAPNYGLPDPNMFGPFFDPYATSITINFIGSDSVTFAGSLLPKDGVNSLYFTAAGVTSTGVNTPQNFAGADGSVNLPPPAAPTGDYNENGIVDAADYVLWRKTLNQSVTAGQNADGNANGTIDAPDYDFWRARFGNIVPGSGASLGPSAVPEPSAIVLALLAVGAFAARRKR